MCWQSLMLLFSLWSQDLISLFLHNNNEKRSIISLKAICAWLLISLALFSFNAYADTPTLKKLIEESVSLLLKKDTDGAIEKLDQVLLLSPNHAEAHFRKGQALIQKRQARQGLQEIIKATELDPKNVRFSLYLATIYTKQGNLDKAMAEYQRIVDTGTRDPRVKEAEKLLSLATGQSLARKKETSAALLIFNGLLLEYPNDVQILFSIGNAYMELNRIEEAERTFAKLFKLNPQSQLVNMSLARIYERTNRPQLAMKHLKIIMDMKKNNTLNKRATVQYYILKGREELRKRQWEAALKSFQKVVTIDPSRTEAFFNISMANLQLGNTLMAERGFLSVLKVTPNDFSARLNLGQMYFDIGKTEQAKEQLQYIVDHDKSKRYAAEAKKRLNLLHSLLADQALKSGNIETGLEEYEKALSYFSANTKASFTRGMIFVKQKKYEEARKEFESVIKFNPKNIPARMNLAKIYENLAMFSEAAEQYEVIMQEDKNGKAGKFAASKWKITKGRGLWKEKKLSEAEKIFQEVTQEQPNNYQAFAFLGILQASRGKLKEAAISYQRVLDLSPTNYAVKILLGKVYEQLGLDTLAANEYRSIIFAGGKIPQVPEAERRLAAVEARLSGFSNTLSYRFNYDSNLTLNDAFPIKEVRSDLALSFNYALKTRDDLSFTLSWSPTYSSYHFNQTDYLVSVLQSFVRLGTPDNNWNVSFMRQDQDSLVNDTALSQATSINLGKSKKIFSKAMLDLTPSGFEGENIATNVSVSGGLRHISSFSGVRLESILGTLSMNLSQQLRWGITASAGYTMSIYQNLTFVQLLGPDTVSQTNEVTGLTEQVKVKQSIRYDSDDYENYSHTGSLSLQRVLAPGFVGNLRLTGTFTGYTNPDSGAEARGKISKRMNFGASITPSITYMFYKDIRFVVSGTMQKNVSNLRTGQSLGGAEESDSDSATSAIASFQSTSLGNYTRFSADVTFIMNF